MSLPTSQIFDLFDWNSRSALSADSGDRLITDAEYGVLDSHIVDRSVGVSLDFEAVRVKADANNKVLTGPEIGELRLALPTPSTFTFECDFTIAGDLPKDFSDPANRVFVGACNRQGYTAGFLISAIGVGVCAYATAPEAEINVLQGSARYLLTAAGFKSRVTLRAILDGSTGDLSVLLTDTASAYTANDVYGVHHLAYSTKAPVSSMPQDQVVITVSANKGATTLCATSLRLASTLLKSPLKPVALIDFVSATTVGKRLRLDGSTSYDPDLGVLTYHWEMNEAPLGATTALRGAAYPTASVVVDTAAIATFSYKVPTSRADGTFIYLRKGAGANPLTVELIDGYFHILLETNDSGIAVTTLYDLVNALTSSTAAGYTAEVANLLALVPTDATQTDYVLPEMTLQLFGGAGSTIPVTSLQVDKPGIYRFSLVVSNGLRSSEPAMVTVFSSLDEQLLRHRPNTSYLFQGMGDFWNMVSDKAALTVGWSAAAQIISGELLKLLQNDYNKSIRDISRKYQRRWLDYPMRIAIPDVLNVTAVPTGGVYGLVAPSLAAFTPGGTKAGLSTMTQSGTTSALPSVLAPCVLVSPTGYATKSVVTAQAGTSIKFSADSLAAVSIVDSGTRMVIVKDPTSGTPDCAFVTPLGKRLAKGILPGDLLMVDMGGTTIIRTITGTTVVGSDSHVVDNTLQVDSTPLSADGVGRPWQIVRGVANTQLFQHPYFDLGVGVNLEVLGITFGDIAEISYVSPVSSVPTTVYLPILLVTSTEVFLDWRALADGLNAATGAATYTVGNLVDTIVSAKLTALIRTEQMPLDADITSIPYMGSSTVNPEFTENSDYVIKGGRLSLLPLAEFAVSTTSGSNIVYVYPALAVLPTTLVVQEGEVGVYPVIGRQDDGGIALAHMFAATGTSKGRVPRYSFGSPPPATMWAELTYFDNYKAIEDNFGILVGLPKSILSDNKIELDYLTIVKSLCFAFVSGPSVGNLRLAANAFMGLPYTDAGGNVTAYTLDDTGTLGRVVVKELGKPGYQTYFFPKELPLAVNPATGRQIKAVSQDDYAAWYLPLDTQRSLSTAINDASVPTDKRKVLSAILKSAQDADDSVVTPFTSIVSSARVYDYVSNPSAINSMYTAAGALGKLHTFVVELPRLGITNPSMVSVFKNFVNEWKPAHTAVEFFAVDALHDDIDVRVSWKAQATLHITDTIYTSPMIPDSWPTDGVLTENPDVVTWDESDAHERYNTSYAACVLDDVGGDGSWNTKHHKLDMVNTVDSDIDVLASKMLVPVIKDAGTPEFLIGEGLEILIDGTLQTSTGWTAAPPVIEYIGAGQHPKIPFGVYSPQNKHPSTYLYLGFYRADGTYNSGNERRLRAIQDFNPIADLQVRGLTSGAVATVRFCEKGGYVNLDIALDPDHPESYIHARYFHIERLFGDTARTDKGPEVRTVATITQYIPIGGYTPPAPENLKDETAFIDQEIGLQSYTFDPDAGSDADQMVPNFTSGFYVRSYLGAPQLTWGYQEQGLVGVTLPTPPWLPDADAEPIENLHIGRKISSFKGLSKYNGFTTFEIPKPVISKITENGVVVRIEGYYFVADDPTRVGVPTAVSFGGTKGGCWVFLRETGTPDEHPVVACGFETGTSAGRTVLGLDGADQTSTGHVINATLPNGLVAGTYDVILRQYRPYKMAASDSAYSLHIDEAVMLAAVEIVSVGSPDYSFGDGAFGEGLFG